MIRLPIQSGSVLLAAALLGNVGSTSAAAGGLAGRAGNEPDYHWLEVPLEISGLPPSSSFVPISARLPVGRWRGESGVAGDWDEFSVTLWKAEGESRVETEVQVSPEPGVRGNGRRLGPGTPPSVSYLAEEEVATVSGGAEATLSWMASADGEGKARYQLRFGIPRSGTRVQVPYPPYNYRHFDAAGHARPVRQFPNMQIRPQYPLDGAVGIYEGQELVTRYHTGPKAEEVRRGDAQLRRPFLYPLIGPDGVPLTGFGKPHDPTGSHAHHYSLWVAHAQVNGLDFWSEKGGFIVHENFEDLQDGPVFCRLVQNAAWKFGATNVLKEQRTVTVYRSTAGFRLLEIQLVFSPAGSNRVEFGQTTFGFLAARVAQSLAVFDGGGEIQNGRGDLNERGAHLKRAEWLDQSGPVAPGKWGGVAILDHPENAGHPTVWHCRNDGWAGASFNGEAESVLEPGSKLTLRYRVVLHRGNASQGAVQQRFEEYEARPELIWGNCQRIPD